METLTYNREATIVIDESSSYWGEPKPKIVTAGDISGTYRQYNAIVQREANRIERMDKLKEYLLENADDLGDHAPEIANILGLDLDSIVDVTINIVATVTMTVPFGKSIEDLSEYDFDVEITCNNGDFDIESTDYLVDTIDY